MIIAAAGFAIFITCWPILIPVMIRGRSVASLFGVDNYRHNFRDLQFLIVVTAAVGISDLVEKILEAKLSAVSVPLQFALFACFLMSLVYALVQVGRYAEIGDDTLLTLDRWAVSRALFVNSANIVAVLIFKWITT